MPRTGITGSPSPSGLIAARIGAGSHPRRRGDTRVPIFQSDQTCKLRRVNLLVPESCAEGLRDLARVLRDQQRERTADPFGWGKLSPSAELLVDPQSGARCAIRDTRQEGGERYYWTVTVVGVSDPVAAGRASELGEARSRAEAALVAYAQGGDEWSVGGVIG